MLRGYEQLLGNVAEIRDIGLDSPIPIIRLEEVVFVKKSKILVSWRVKRKQYPE